MSSNGRITVVGLGSGDEADLTLGVVSILQEAEQLFLRTENHPVVPWLKQQGLTYEAFDDVYERYGRFEPVYEDVTERLIRAAGGTHIVYAVPGHPMVAEKTTEMLLQKGRTRGVDVEIKGGHSFLDTVFVRLQIDPIDGFILLNALDFTPDQCNPRMTTVIAQVYDQLTASDVKLTLMERYPDDVDVIVAHSLGVDGEESVRTVPLYELDHRFPVSSLSVVVVPPVPEDVTLTRDFSEFVNIVATLRSPNGCPWDRKQTHESLRKYLVEETAEFIEAVNKKDPEHMCDELGDVLLQIGLHAQIAAENETFTIRDVIQRINEKLIRRHPHVFGDEEVKDATEVSENWRKIKEVEKRAEGKAGSKSLADGIPATLPTLSRAVQLQQRAAEFGFDWTEVGPVVDKVREELTECLEASGDDVEKELGDLLFAVVNLARFLDVDPEQALRRAESKFTVRFDQMKQKAEREGLLFHHLTLEQMEALWQSVKQSEAVGR